MCAMMIAFAKKTKKVKRFKKNVVIRDSLPFVNQLFVQ